MICYNIPYYTVTYYTIIWYDIIQYAILHYRSRARAVRHFAVSRRPPRTRTYLTVPQKGYAKRDSKKRFLV